MEYLQANPGESEETAWDSSRPELSYTGRQLDELSLPTSARADYGWRCTAGGSVFETLGEAHPAWPTTNVRRRCQTDPRAHWRVFGGADAAKRRVNLGTPRLPR